MFLRILHYFKIYIMLLKLGRWTHQMALHSSVFQSRGRVPKIILGVSLL